MPKSENNQSKSYHELFDYGTARRTWEDGAAKQQKLEGDPSRMLSCHVADQIAGNMFRQLMRKNFTGRAKR
jgi:hypothetical protein